MNDQSILLYHKISQFSNLTTFDVIFRLYTAFGRPSTPYRFKIHATLLTFKSSLTYVYSCLSLNENDKNVAIFICIHGVVSKMDNLDIILVLNKLFDVLVDGGKLYMYLYSYFVCRVHKWHLQYLMTLLNIDV